MRFTRLLMNAVFAALGATSLVSMSAAAEMFIIGKNASILHGNLEGELFGVAIRLAPLDAVDPVYAGQPL
jgi:hypothetical protein